MKNAAHFWAWFSVNRDRFKEQLPDFLSAQPLLEELTLALHQYSPGLFAEVSITKEMSELIITPHGMKQFFADALALVQQAPEMEGWHLLTLKPAQETCLEFMLDGILLHCADIFFEPFQGKDSDDICVRILHRDYQDVDTRQKYKLINCLYYCLDSLLGEKAVSFDINYIAFGKLAEPPHAGILPIQSLPGYLKWRMSERSNYLVLFPAPQISLLEGKKNERPFLVTINRAYRNYSFCMDFPWLLKVVLHYKQMNAAGQPRDDMDTLYQLEEKWSRTLGSQGHHVASESFDGQRIMYYYVSLPGKEEFSITGLSVNTDGYYPEEEWLFDPFWVKVLPFM